MKKFLTLLLPLFFSQPAFAEWKSSLNADLEFESSVWKKKTVGPDSEKWRSTIGGKIPMALRKGKSFRMKFTPSFLSDPNSPSKREEFFWDIPEGFVQVQAQPFTIQAGLNTFSWGDTDIFNPLDVLNVRRYYDPLKSEKMGTLALLLKKDFEKFFVEGVYIPQARKAELPGENSRWMPREVYRVKSIATSGGQQARIILPSTLKFRFVEDAEIEKALQNNYAFRAKFRFEGFDWSLVHFAGSSPTPDVRIRTISLGASVIRDNVYTVTAGPDIGLQAGFYPIRLTGTSFTWVLGDFLVKGVGAYTHVVNRRFDLPSRIWESALGVERTFSLGNGSVTSILQGSYVNRGDGLETGTISLARMFDRAAMGAFRWAPSDSWTILGSFLRDLEYKGNLFHGEITTKVADGWKLKTAVDILGGDLETPLGTYRENDRVSVGVLAQF